MRRVWLILGAVCGLLVVGAGLAFVRWRMPEETAAIRGSAIAERMGCFGCHGPGGTGAVPDPANGGGAIPAWHPRIVAMFVKNEQELREWILYGKPERLASIEQPEGASDRIRMPAYEGLLSDAELDDLVAYFVAVSGAVKETPEPAHEGRRICERMGCFGCHGPSGMGGVSNPRSFKGRIPAWDGQEFLELVQDDAELREWILDGRIRRFEQNSVARGYLDRQIIRMPAYRKHLSDEDLEKIVAFIRWLRSGE